MQRLEAIAARAPFILLLAALAFTLSACASGQARVLGEIQGELAQEHHECLPLGWVPEAAGPTFVPVDDVESIPQDMWLPPLWEAKIPDSAKTDRATRLIIQILDDLSAKGLVHRSALHNGSMYQLTFEGLKYYSNGYFHGLNPQRATYLCYSNVIPQRVLWTRRIPSPRGSSGAWFETAFQWRAGPDAAWADGDELIQSHSVILSPAATPLVLTFSEDAASWRIEHISGSPFGTLVDARAWGKSGSTQ